MEKVNIQRFLWNVAGCDIELLDKIRSNSDKQKYAAIGSVILVTSLLAFITGTAAAWWFTQSKKSPDGNFLIAMIFGVFWSLFIFCIDRCLVITIKKKENAGTNLMERSYSSFKMVILPFALRCVLAFIIATMISIPAEIIVFKGKISQWQEKWELTDIAENVEIAKKIHFESNDSIAIVRTGASLDDCDSQITNLNSEERRLQRILANLKSQKVSVNCSEYVRISQQISIKESEITTTKKQAEDKKNVLFNLRQNLSQAKSKWEETQARKISAYEDTLKSVRSSLRGVKNEKETLTRTFSSLAKRQAKGEEAIDSVADRTQSKLDEADLFLTYYDVLQWGVKQKGNESDKFILWLIRIMFFVVEILPTFVKLISSYGEYEARVEENEKRQIEFVRSDKYSKLLNDILEKDLVLESNLAEIKVQHEKELQQEILNKLKDSKIKVAESIIKKYVENNY